MPAFETVPLSVEWFVKDIAGYQQRPEFVAFQRLFSIDYQDTQTESGRQRIGKALRNHSSIFFEIGRAKGGAFFPEKIYRQDVNFYNRAPEQVAEADELILSRPMCNSLKLRFDTLRSVIIPYALRTRLRGRHGMTIGNLGSGMGRDIQHVCTDHATDGQIARVINIDMDKDAIRLGRAGVPEHLADKIRFYRKNFLRGNPEGTPYDLAIMVGIICPLTNKSAVSVLRTVRDQMAPGAAVIVSSSSHKMRDYDPICSINIQLCAEWALNCRTESDLITVLSDAGYTDIEILGDPSGYNLIAIATAP